MAYKFKNLVFEGGGVKGIAYGGALEILEEREILDNIKRVAGTSAGAITAGLLAVGYTYEEVKEILSKTKFSDFKDNSWGWIRLLHEYGWFKGNVFEEWFESHLEKKTQNRKITFGEIAEEAKTNKNYRSLYVTGTNLNKKITDFFDEERTPKMPIAEAI